ncbi:hemolysin family protein [Bacillus horti]
MILATAFFVGAEFAFVKVRTSRVDQLIQEGNKTALLVRRVISNLDGYLAACQLGITITALGLGWLGEPTIEKLLHPLIEELNLPDQAITLISFIIAFAIMTFLHVVFGELAPKSVAIQKAERLSLLLARPLIWYHTLMYPFIWVLNGSANQFLKLFGMRSSNEHAEAHSEDELRIILSESFESGEINQSEYGYVRKIFDFDDLLAKEIMIPRTDMVCLELDNTLEQNMKIIKEEQYTRFPVIADNKDSIVGMVNTKEFFLILAEKPDLDLKEIIRPVLTVIDATPVKQLLKEMQKQRKHLAILVDEYGGTSGLVTIEDILEEIVGDIRDEFDQEEKPEIEKLSENHLIVDGKVPITEINELLVLHIENDDFNTVGGWLYSQNQALREGHEVDYEGYTFKVLKKEKHRIRKVEITKAEPSIEDDQSESENRSEEERYQTESS